MPVSKQRTDFLTFHEVYFEQWPQSYDQSSLIMHNLTSLNISYGPREDLGSVCIPFNLLVITKLIFTHAHMSHVVDAWLIPPPEWNVRCERKKKK